MNKILYSLYNLPYLCTIRSSNNEKTNYTIYTVEIELADIGIDPFYSGRIFPRMLSCLDINWLLFTVSCLGCSCYRSLLLANWWRYQYFCCYLCKLKIVDLKMYKKFSLKYFSNIFHKCTSDDWYSSFGSWENVLSFLLQSVCIQQESLAFQFFTQRHYISY